MEKMKGNKNAEKWSLEKAEDLSHYICLLIESRQIQYLSDIHIVLKSSNRKYTYVLKKFGLYKIVSDLIKNQKPNRGCLYKRTEEQKKRDRKNSKSIYKTNRQNPNFRIRQSISSLLNYHIKNRGAKRSKTKSKLDMLDFTMEELRDHLQNQFTKGMSFDNYGKWHIDHIIPCSWLDLSDETQFKQCWSLRNLKPMWGSENISKNNKYSENTQLNLI